MLKSFMALNCIMSSMRGRGTPSFSLLETNVGSLIAPDLYKWLTSVEIPVFKREGSTDRTWRRGRYTRAVTICCYWKTSIFYTSDQNRFRRKSPPRWWPCTAWEGAVGFVCCVLSVFFNTWFFVHTRLLAFVVWKLDSLSEEVRTLCVLHFE